MSLVYPIVVFYEKGLFHSQIPSVGDYESFIRNHIEASGLNEDELEIFLYNRQDWIRLLIENRDEGHKFVIEKERIFTTKKESSTELMEIPVDWAKEDGLEEFYSSEEIAQIAENKAYLMNQTALTEEVLQGMPHGIPKKMRLVEGVVKKDVIVSEVMGQSYALPPIEETEEI